MPVQPFETPATAAKVFDHVRVSDLNISQRAVGQDIQVFYRVTRYRVTESGSEDAPEGMAVGVVNYTPAQLAADPVLGPILFALTEQVVVKAVASGQWQTV